LSGGDQGTAADQPSERAAQAQGGGDVVFPHQRTAAGRSRRSRVALRAGGRGRLPRLARQACAAGRAAGVLSRAHRGAACRPGDTVALSTFLPSQRQKPSPFLPSSPRKRGPIVFAWKSKWIPAFAGMTTSFF